MNEGTQAIVLAIVLCALGAASGLLVGYLLRLTQWLFKGRPMTAACRDGRVIVARQSPGWFLPAGIVAVMLGTLGFLGSAAVGGGGDFFGSLLAGLLNPLFLVGFPLGVYWLYRFGRTASPKAPLSDEGNPRLTHCPDCGRHVSRLAASCPQCGRPLTPEEPP